jgi:hypothetical protein
MPCLTNYESYGIYRGSGVDQLQPVAGDLAGVPALPHHNIQEFLKHVKGHNVPLIISLHPSDGITPLPDLTAMAVGRDAMVTSSHLCICRSQRCPYHRTSKPT